MRRRLNALARCGALHPVICALPNLVDVVFGEADPPLVTQMEPLQLAIAGITLKKIRAERQQGDFFCGPTEDRRKNQDL
jgi:hypothetical protein